MAVEKIYGVQECDASKDATHTTVRLIKNKLIPETYIMKILVVDDETDIKALFQLKFRKEIKSQELDFAFAFSGEEALNYLNNHVHEAVLILSDINMPGMSGLELLKRIKKQFENPPPKVMMVTAYGDQENYNSAMQNGADDFLTKPLDFNLLKEKLKLIN